MAKNSDKFKLVSIVFAMIALVCVAFIVVTHKDYKSDGFTFDDESIEDWNDSWEINYDGNISQNNTLPIEVPIENGKTVMMRKTLPDKIKKYNCIMLESKHQDIEVSIGGIKRASYSNENYRHWGKTTPSGIVLIPLYNTDSLADVVIHISSDSFFSGKIGNIYLGNEKSLVVMILKSNMLWLLMTIIVFIMGIVCAASFLTYSQSFKISKAMHYLAIFAILSAIWSFAQSGIRQLFIDDITVLEAIGYCSYLALPIPLVLYVNWITDRRYEKAIGCYSLVAMVNFIVQNLLQLILGIGFFEMRYVSQLSFMLGIVLIAAIIVFEARREFNLMVKLLMVGTIGLFLGVISEITFHTISFAGDAYNQYVGGALAFLMLGFFYTMMCVSKEQQLKKDAESANRAKTEFLASMSHEIKTPLNAILGMNEMIMRDSSEDNIREYSANVSDSGKALLSLVNDIFDFSKMETGELTLENSDYQMKPLLRDLIKLVEGKLNGKEVKLILNIDENIPSILHGDEARIKQIVTNLLTNAVKYTQKGEITFTVKPVVINDDDVDLYFSVKDTGAGIRKEDIDRFKDSFVRLENVKNSNISGLGLGLTITTRLLALMGSKLDIDSVYGKGSDFHFDIWQKVVDKTPVGDVRPKVDKTPKKKKITFTAPEIRVLAVDDNKMNLRVLSGILKTTKMQIETCESGAKCLELCKDTRYDIVFMDHMMPEMDGIETFKKIRENTELKSNDSIIFVLTANTVTGAAEMYKEVGFDYYLKKPIDVSELNEVLQMYIPKDRIRPVEAS